MTPENYENGSIAGFFTYQEMLDELDSMHAKYPHLITAKTPIDNHLSIEGRPIYWLRISDNPMQDEAEPEVLYTALHHAREPGSLSQMIFFMWYVLENYETDEQLQYLVNQSELYFVPCVNPDGYIYNETTNPDGGGLWRKNRRQNEDGSFGVDLNRNYGLEWGFDDNGSSPNPESQTYRGTAPFSEPEVQAVRDLCNAHRFQIALNYHTHGDLLIYPWGFSDTPTDDSISFRTIAEAMTLENFYLAGTGSETVGYNVNGVSDDWMYGETGSKPFIYSMTPEVGGDGFWPDQDRIITDNKRCILQNTMAVALLYNYGKVYDRTEAFVSDLQNDLFFEVKRYGLMDGLLTVSLEGISNNIVSVGSPKVFDLAQGESIEDVISYELSSSVQIGDAITFYLHIDNGDYVETQLIQKTYGTTVPDYYNDASSLEEWTTEAQGSGTWDVTEEDFVSAPSSITDSPNGNYQAQVFSTISMQTFIPFEDAEKTILSFWARWSIEAEYDYVQLQLQLEEDGEYYPVCGKYTKEGSQFQDEGKPIYDDVSDWVQEEIDLTAFSELGSQFRLRFILDSDQFIESDGFYFDDWTVQKFSGDITETLELEQNDFSYSQNRPNPANDKTWITIHWGAQKQGNAILEVYNTIGEKIWQTPISTAETEIEITTKNWPAGTYLYRLVLDDQTLPIKRMLIVK